MRQQITLNTELVMYPKINQINNIRLCVNDQTLTDTYTQRYTKSIAKIITGRKKMVGVDVKPKRKIPDMSSIDF